MSVEIAYHDLLTLSPCSSWDLNSAQVQFPAVKHIRFNYSEINWWMSLTNTVRVAWNVIEIKGMKSLYFMSSSCKNQRIRPNCFIKFGSACPRKSKRIRPYVVADKSGVCYHGITFVTHKEFASRQVTIDIQCCCPKMTQVQSCCNVHIYLYIVHNLHFL